MQTVSVADACIPIGRGATLVDIREASETACERIPGARHAPRSRVDGVPLALPRPLIFHCRSDRRPPGNAGSHPGLSRKRAARLLRRRSNKPDPT